MLLRSNLVTSHHHRPSLFSHRHQIQSTKITSKRNWVGCAAKFDGQKDDVMVKERSVSVLLLAGGSGKRMGVSIPKQYLPLLGQPIALYSFYTFCEMNEVKEIVVVCDPSYKDVFEDASDEIEKDLKFALPGKERQDSVFNGLQPMWYAMEKYMLPHSTFAKMLVTKEGQWM